MNCQTRYIRDHLLVATASLIASHQEVVGRLEKDRSVLMDEWTDLPWKVSLIHGGYGIGGETGEIVEALLERDVKGLLKELGDAAFYGQLILIGVMRASVQFGFEYPNETESGFCPGGFDPVRDLQILQSRAMDAIKKVALYNQGITDPTKDDPETPHYLNIVSTARDFLFGLALTAEIYGFSADDILEGNIEKLVGKEGRYREGTYSDEAAKERRDELAPEGATVFGEVVDQAKEERIAKERAFSEELAQLTPAERADRFRAIKGCDRDLYDVRHGKRFNPYDIYGGEFAPIVIDEVKERWESEFPDGLDLENSMSPAPVPHEAEIDTTANGGGD